MRAYVYARQRGLLWGSLASCGRLSIGQMPRWHRTAAVANRRAGCQPAPHRASVSTFMSHPRSMNQRFGVAAPETAIYRPKLKYRALFDQYFTIDGSCALGAHALAAWAGCGHGRGLTVREV